MHKMCTIIHIFLINLVCNVIPVLGKYCYYNYYNSYRSYKCKETSGGAIAGAVVGCLIFLGFVVAIVVCICYKKHKAKRTMPAPRFTQPAIMTVHQSYQSQPLPPPQPMYNQYPPYPQPGMNQQNMAYPPPLQQPPPPPAYYGQPSSKY